MSLAELCPPKIPLYPKVRLIGRTACFCYFSVLFLLERYHGTDIVEDLAKSGFLFALGLLALGSGMLSLVTPRKKKKIRDS